MTGKGPARSRNRESIWRRIVAKQPCSGLSIRAWCNQHDVSEPSFYAWRRELARRDAERRASPPDALRPAGFVELEVSRDAADVSNGTARGAALQIVVADVRVEVTPGFDNQTLQRILEVLRAVGSRSTASC